MENPVLKNSILEVKNRVALLTFDRDDVRNALTGTEIASDILKALSWSNASEEVSVLIMSGAGTAFSSGGNVLEMKERRGIFAGTVRQIQEQYRQGIQQIPLAMEAAEIPLIAAINGPAIGAGFDLACMCDLRIGSEKSVFGETFVSLGIIPGDGGAWFLQRIVGYQRAAELTLTGRLVKADEALKMGILLETVDSGVLLQRAWELAEVIAAKPPQAVRKAKRLLKFAQQGSLSDVLDLSACFQGMLHHTPDHIEAINAFLEKREGRYTGQ
jgi:enoyl-CoA hydratase/carnithine racemase